MNGPAALLEARAVCVRHGHEAAVDRVDLDVAGGEIVTLVGPNGSGKTTLVRTVIGLREPDSGRVWRRPGLRLGYVPQRLAPDPTLPLTAGRFVALSGAGPGAARTALGEAGAAHLAGSALTDLSGGELRRVLLARALARAPDLLVLDEPTAGVDVAGQAALYERIDAVRRQRGCGVLLVSHDLHLVMASSDRVVCLNRHVCCTGAPEAIVDHPEYLALFGGHVRPGIGVYTHDHDHDHDLHGNVAAPGDPREPSGG